MEIRGPTACQHVSAGSTSNSVPVVRLQHCVHRSLYHTCRAVSSLGLWVLALLDYHHARDVVKPFQDSLTTAEKVLTEVGILYSGTRKWFCESFSSTQFSRSVLRLLAECRQR